MDHKNWIMTAALVGGAACSGGGTALPNGAEGDTGKVELELTNAPADATCLKFSVTGSRSTSRSIDLTPGASTTYLVDRLPVGIATVTGQAYSVACSAVGAATVPAFVAESSVTVRIDPLDVAKVVLKLIRNGRASIGVDFEASNDPYLVPTAPGVITKAILTVGESVNTKADGTPYRMVGIPDGLGALDNGDGTFTLLANHELPGNGVVHAHGSKGAFVSKWTIRKSDLTVLKGEDLMQQFVAWDPAASAYKAAGPGPVFQRFCSADLAAPSAYFDAASGLGTAERLFLDGEESGTEGKGLAHALNGVTYELPRLGKMAFENSVAAPLSGQKTVVVSTDDGQNGQVYLYIGTKTSTGSVIDKAGLTNGNTFAVKVAGFPVEPVATGIPSGTDFSLVDLGNVENTTGTAFDAASVAAGSTTFQRPEDAAWDPKNPNDLYFVTTSSFTTPSRLWRLHFTDAQNLALGGKIDMLLDGTEGFKMADNITVDKKGHIYIQEDIGGQDALGKIFRYDIATDTLTLIAQHNPALFTPGAAGFLTRDEESSGIIDASEILGAGWLLVDVQAHFTNADPELVEGGQFLAVFDPAGK